MNEEAGRVMEPRKEYSRGQQDIPPGGTEGKADGFQWPEGSSPGYARASIEDTTGVSERGMSSIGVARELGRATCLLVTFPDWGTG